MATNPIASALQAAAKITDRNPSIAQKESGNYAKGKFPWHGLTIAIENPKGSERSGIDKGGKAWRVKMPSHYGYVLGTEGRDKDHVDVCVGDDHAARTVFVIDQVDAATGRFDEHKAFLNFPDKDAALMAYGRAFSDGRAKERIGAVNEMTIDQFKRWVQSNDTKKPLGHQAKSYAAGGSVMPLDKSGTKASVGRNIATEMGAGKPRRQAIAIALDTARRYAKKASGGRVGFAIGGMPGGHPYGARGKRMPGMPAMPHMGMPGPRMPGMWSGGDPDSIAPELTRDIVPPKAREPATEGVAGFLNRMAGPSQPSRQERAMAEAKRVMDQSPGEFATEAGVGSAAPYVLGPIVSRIPKRYVAAGAAGLLGSLIGGDKGTAEPPQAPPAAGMSPREVRNAEIKAHEAQIERQQELLTKRLGEVGATKFRGVGEEAGMARQKAMEEAAKPYNENIAAIRARMGELRGANDDEDKAMIGVERRADQARRDVLSEGNQPFNKTPVGEQWNKAGPLAPAGVGAATAFLERALHGPKAGWKLPIGVGTAAGALAANVPLGWDAFFQPTVNPNKTAMQTYGQELKIGQHPRAQEFLDYADKLPTPNPVSEQAYNRFTNLPDAGKRMLFGAGEGAVGASTGFAGAVGLERLAKGAKGAYNHFFGSQPGGSTGPLPGGPLVGGGGGGPPLPGAGGPAPIPLTAMPESRMLPSPSLSEPRLADRLPAYREAAGPLPSGEAKANLSAKPVASSAPDPANTIIVDAHGARYPGGHPEGQGGRFATPDPDAKVMTRAQWNKAQRAADKAAKSNGSAKSLTNGKGNGSGTDEKKSGGPVQKALDFARKFARGGRVTVGPVVGATGGRTDALPVDVPSGAFVIPADVVSALGEGNTLSGNKALDKMFGKQGAKAHHQPIGIKISDGEYVISPETVARIGKGDMDAGHKLLDQFVIQCRQKHIAQLSSLPGPSR